MKLADLHEDKGTSIRFRPVETGDAAYIHQLRSDPHYGRHLSAAAPTVEAQRAWLESYQTRASAGLEAYFIVERLDGKPCGTMRIYNVTETAATWGSFILDSAKPAKAALHALIMVHRVIFDVMGKQHALFDVRKQNERALALYLRFGATEIDKDELNIYFRLTSREFAEKYAALSRAL